MVCFRVGNISYEIGTASFLYSFFSTVAYRLEKGRWGSRFPIIMNELYQGQLSFEKALVAKQTPESISNFVKEILKAGNRIQVTMMPAEEKK